MKFFLQKKLSLKNKYKVTGNSIFNVKIKYAYYPSTEVTQFSRFLTKNGFFTKNKLVLSGIYKNINFFIYNNYSFIKNNYPSLNRWILDDIFDKKLNYMYIFNVVADLIKPPFVIKSVAIPKKLKKKKPSKNT